MQVSIIIPTYNYGKFINDALRSVEAQTFKEWECIVIDDASTDDTAAIVDTFVQRDSRFRYFRMQRNAGVSAARDRGFAEAKGGYIQMLDADDVIASQKLEVQEDFLNDHPRIDLVYSNYVPFTGQPVLSGQGAYRRDEQLSGAGGFIVRRLLRGNIFRLNTLLFRTSVLQDVGGFLTGFRYAEDWDFWLRIASRGHRFSFLGDPRAMSGVRREHRSLSSDLPAMNSHYLPVLQNVWNRGDISGRNRLELVFRYALFRLDRVLLRKGPVLVLPGNRWPFLALVGCATVILLPFYPFYKLVQAFR